MAGFTRPVALHGPGDVIGARYMVTRALGRGGHGTVYAARDINSRRPIALKVLSSVNGAIEPDRVVRFFREAEVAGQLSSSHVARVFDVGQDPKTGALFLAMELIEGVDLERYAHRHASKGAALSESFVTELCVQVLRGLSAAHVCGMVHRDLKPANIMLARVSEHQHLVKVVDFGIVRATGSSLTVAGQALGTPAYMSPEQVVGAPLDGRADLYALGVVMFRCVTGRLPFEHADPVTLADMHVRKPIPDLRALAPGCSDHFLGVIRTALAKKPAERFPSASEMMRSLERGRQPAVRGAALASRVVSALWRAGVAEVSNRRRRSKVRGGITLVDVRESCYLQIDRAQSASPDTSHASSGFAGAQGSENHARGSVGERLRDDWSSSVEMTTGLLAAADDRCRVKTDDQSELALEQHRRAVSPRSRALSATPETVVGLDEVRSLRRSSLGWRSQYVSTSTPPAVSPNTV